MVFVRWNGAQSTVILVLNGMRQGGVLSPSLFTLYINYVAVALRNFKAGFHVKGYFISCMLYGDDIFHICASVVLQTC